MGAPLPRHIPAGVMIASTRHEPRARLVEVLCDDRTWQRAELLAWARCQAGWAALARWDDGQQDWLEYEPRYIRPPRS